MKKRIFSIIAASLLAISGITLVGEVVVPEAKAATICSYMNMNEGRAMITGGCAQGAYAYRSGSSITRVGDWTYVGYWAYNNTLVCYVSPTIVAK
ncbi:MAG: hypothetical protein LBG99_04080 [Propionibacteriaceae bacterium]|jgi:hypothetical protein|nr:hypothetical protein [Propionibacteriaceae bacterium]